MILRLRYKFLIVVGTAVSLALVAIAFYYVRAEESAILSEHQRALHKMTDSLAQAMETIMLENHAEIMTEYSRRLKALPGVVAFQIMRNDGSEAFRDNRTIDDVNRRLGRRAFEAHRDPEKTVIMSPHSPSLLRAVVGGEEQYAEDIGADGERLLVLLDPVLNDTRCKTCHGDDQKTRGVIRIVSSLAVIEREVLQARIEAIAFLTLSLVCTMLVTGFMLGRSVIQPIEAVTRAFTNVATHNFSEQLAVASDDEVGKMASIFNRMSGELKTTYEGLMRERLKLETIIQSAREAIIATDAGGTIILVNAASEGILGKSIERIQSDGFERIFDDPAVVRRLLSRSKEQLGAEKISYGGKELLVSAATISDRSGAIIGSASLIRDISEEHRLMSELQRVSITDALTGLFNRRHLDATVQREFDRSRRTHSPLSIIIFDVDHFKRFNDSYGHDMGDRVLQQVSAAFRGVLRGHDVACRYGGEEFLAILPGTGSEGARVVAERLRAEVEGSRLDSLGGRGVTISLGIACCPELPAATAEALVAAADGALYRAKDGGRNRSEIAVPADLT